MSGRRVANLSDRGAVSGRGASAFGLRTFLWNGRDDSGAPIARGVYFVLVETGGAVTSAKLAHLGQ